MKKTIAEPLISPDVTPETRARDQAIESARKIQSQYDKDQESAKANKLATDLYRQRQFAQLNASIRIANQEYESKMQVAKPVAEMDTSPIPSYNIVSQGYYIGYHSAYGVLLAKPFNNVMMPFQLRSKKQIKHVMDVKTDKQNILSRADFDAILKAKPSFEMLGLAYNLPVAQWTFDNIIERMKLSDATIVF